MFAPPCQDLKGIGGDGHFQRVMLGGPGDFKAACLGHLDHFERVIAQRLHISRRIEPFEIDCEVEFHAGLL